MQCCDAGVATPGDLEVAYAGAVRGEKGGGVHLLRLCQKTGPVWGQLSTGTCRALLEVFIKHVRVRYAGRLGCLWVECLVVDRLRGWMGGGPNPW